uniref:Tensin 3, tandem duplicate 1 n=1 Tax=Mola mola TaxID=94237 RepID=A0A3Q3X217_MOLML
MEQNTKQIDLTYITECIITILCPAGCPEHVYLQNLQDIIVMLQSKHGHNYMIINLSQRNDTLSRLNHKVLDTGWVDLLAPNLNQIFTVCSLMENWLQRHSKHVLVLHCRGNKGRLGVLLASYIQFSNMAASADFSLDHFAMRRFYSDKLSTQMTPSQKRYVGMLGSLLKGELRLNPSPSFLLCVVLHGPPKLRADGGKEMFQSKVQLVMCVYMLYSNFNAAQTDRLYFMLQPPQLLQGDVMVVCYDKNHRLANRQVVFRLQFHMGFVHENTLTFCKTDLDCADEGIYDLLPSLPTLWHNGHSVTVDYDTLDPVVRRDSYQEVSPLQTGDMPFKSSGPVTSFSCWFEFLW